MSFWLPPAACEAPENRALGQAERLRRCRAGGRSRSAEEWRERVLADTVATTLEDLELYVVEWLARHRFEMLIELGMPRIVRRAS